MSDNNKTQVSLSVDRHPHFLTFVSRRGAGVWTTIPGLSVELLSPRHEFASILWVDLGLRYEMLNHLRIVPTWFPGDASVLGVCEAMQRRSASPPSIDFVTFHDTVVGRPASGLTPSRIWNDDLADAYIAQVHELHSRGRTITLLPLQVALRSGADLDAANTVSLYVDAIESAIRQVVPDIVMFTCEGQPEGGLFAARLAQSALLQYAIGRADRVLCLVRHDSPQRFDDGISVPALIGQHHEWTDRVRIILTRVAGSYQVPPSLQQRVLGCLPFGDFIGRSVSRGRIPTLDLAAETAMRRQPTPEATSYSSMMEALAARVADELFVREVTPELNRGQ